MTGAAQGPLQDPDLAPPGPAPMDSLALADPVVLVLATAPTDGGVNNAKGHLFEQFVARLLHLYGYGEPRTETLNVTRDGIEIDVSATHDLSKTPAIAECKAYSSPVSAAQLGTFHSKLITARYAAPGTQGFFIALPRMTSSGQEQAELIEANDPDFKLLTSTGVVALLRSRRIITECPRPELLTSDLAVVITEDGVYSACLDVNPDSRLPRQVLAWAANGAVPTPVVELLAKHEYAQGLPVLDARNPTTPAPQASQAAPDGDTMVVTVVGSSSDFEYQLPASPRFFVGRRQLVESLEAALDARAGVVVLNAQSGWGKSSAALKLRELTYARGGSAMIVDSRTATARRFVTDAVRAAAQRAAEEGVLVLPEDASWASLASAMGTLKDAQWNSGPLVVFFDQFENVFRYEDLTREFRDLAFSVNEQPGNVTVGFAWKTDLIGWTESHPYQLRDEIRGSASVLALGPFGVSEIDTLIRRLEKAMGQSLARDLKTRLREYSQGLPWLFKKLAGHLLREVQAGATQEQLASEALNVQNLFDSDLAELGPVEQEALRHIARFAPITISEVLERVAGPIVETLVNRRLVVQVGERLDTYWDIFRDYLNTGRVPIEDSYILRQSPNSVARLLNELREDAGDSQVSEIAARLGTSENVVFNLSRELRLLGATSYETNRVRVLREIWDAPDPETELRRRVASALRRHRAFTTFVRLADRTDGTSLAGYTRELSTLFPAVDVTETTWGVYARVFLSWFEYAGLAVPRGPRWHVAPDGTPGTGQLLRGQVSRRIRGAWPQRQANPCAAVLVKIASGEITSLDEAPREIRDLVVLGAVRLVGQTPELVEPSLIRSGSVDPVVLRGLMDAVPGVREGLVVIEHDPSAPSQVVGAAVSGALGAEWSPGTVLALGKTLRSWAKLAGMRVDRAVRRT